MVKRFVGPVYLEPIEHKYHHRVSGVKFSSVTTAIHAVEPHFDEQAVSLAIANQPNNKKQERYIGMTQTQILDFWQMLNDEANVYGTLVHEIVERYLLANKFHFPMDLFQMGKLTLAEAEFEVKVIKAYEALKIDEGMDMYPERIMFSEEYELAGTSDLIIDIDDVWFDVGDYKTNRVFNFFNPFGHQTLKKPFDHLQNCQWSIYTIQLSVYALMYEMETKRKCRQMYVLYWDKQTEQFSKIQLMYLKHEARKILELHKYTSQFK